MVDGLLPRNKMSNYDSISLGQMPLDLNDTIINTQSLGVNSITSLVPSNACDIISNTMHVKGKLVVDGQIVLDEVSLSERLAKIEERVGIFCHTNSVLENRWEKLRKLGEQYRSLEAEIIDQQRVWNSMST